MSKFQFTVTDLNTPAYDAHLAQCMDDVCDHMDRRGMMEYVAERLAFEYNVARLVDAYNSI